MPEPAIDLAAFNVSPTRGFVPDTDPLDRLPDDFRPWDEVAGLLPALIMNREIRAWIARIPPLDAARLQGSGERERAMLVLSALTMAYVWGAREPDFTLPANIAVPCVALAKALGRPPIILHAAAVLNNWRRLDKSQPVSVENVDTQVTFTGSIDEKWFFLATLGVELSGAPVIVALTRALDVAHGGSDSDIAAKLAPVAAGIATITAAFMRMRERCDPYVFYHRIRPFLAGWPAPGLIYAGTSPEPQLFAGGSAAQSSLLQSIDAALGIEHDNPLTRDFLTGMQDYMPPRHRAFVAELRKRSTLRARALSGTPALRAVYNDCIAAVDELRRKHIGITSDYIIKQASVTVGPGTTGTGGTDFVDFLRESRLETARAQLK